MSTTTHPRPAALRPIALVTGASAGIGLAIAELLAARQHDVVLVARRRERLETAAERMRLRGVRVETIVADLAEPAATKAIFDECIARCGRIDVLVNNAGYGLATPFGATPWREHEHFLRVLLTSPMELTHRALPGMRERGFGRVVQVASLAAFAPESAGSLYSAVKRALVSFTRALQLELAGSGVTTTAVCPGFTYSEFHDVMGNRARMNALPKWLWMDAPAVARIGIDAAERGTTVVIPGAVNQLIAGLSAIVPTTLLQRMAPRGVMDRHEPQPG